MANTVIKQLSYIYIKINKGNEENLEKKGKIVELASHNRECGIY